jgi:hypothetical protein
MRKKIFMIIIVALIGISLALPAASQARGWRGGWGWWGPGALAGGVLLGAALAQPWYYYAPPPAYVYPPPAVVYTTPPYYPSQAYAYPDPAVTSQSDGKPSSGQWVTVPGQSVNGKWVPSHKVWVSDNP